MGAEPGWYPDYDAPPGHERYWDGEQWSELRRAAEPGRPAPAEPAADAGADGATFPWRTAVLGAAVLLLVLVVVLIAVRLGGGDDEAGPSTTEASPQQARSASAERRSWTVVEVRDGRTVELDNGAEVRLVGLAVPSGCTTQARAALTDLVGEQSVTLTRRGPDKDADGLLLRYVERDGVDVGKRLLQRGVVTADAAPHTRAASYTRIAERADPAC